MKDDQLEALKKAALAATPQNLDSAEIINSDPGIIDCPICGGNGNVELHADFCNYDGKALGVQFYGIGPEHLAAEAYFRAASPAAILALIEMVEQQAARIASLESRLGAQAGEPVGAIAFAQLDVSDGSTIDFVVADLTEQGRALPIGTKLYAAPVADSAMAKDAERYRWLRDPENAEGPNMVASSDPEELDAAIDAALAASEPKTTGE